MAFFYIGFLPEAFAKTTVVKCVVSNDRSKVSIDGLGLDGEYYAIAYSGSQSFVSNPPNQTGNSDNLFQVEFDFDSNPANIAAGSTEIPTDFIQDDTVYGEIRRASDDFVTASLSAPCSVE